MTQQEVIDKICDRVITVLYNELDYYMFEELGYTETNDEFVIDSSYLALKIIRELNNQANKQNMPNMSYCRFENTARDLLDCVNAINRGEIHELNNYELDGLKDILDLAEQIVDNREYIDQVIEDYD